MEKTSIITFIITSILGIFFLIINSFTGIIQFYIKSEVILLVMTITGFLCFHFYKENMRVFFERISTRNKTKIKKSSLIVFFLSLLILFIRFIPLNDPYESMQNWPIIKSIFMWPENYILIFGIIIAAFTFLINYNSINNSITYEKLSNDRAKKDSPNKIISIITNRYLWVLISIILLPIIIKIPYSNFPFYSQHYYLKYYSYVGPAIEMVRNNNFLHLQIRYLSVPIVNSDGIRLLFNGLPLLEWGLALTYKTLPFLSIQVSTRLFMTAIHILIMTFAYLFFKDWIGKKQCLIIIFLLAINPVINMSTFITVYDSLLIAASFISLFFLNKYLYKEKINYFILSALTVGIAASAKISIILWIIPIATVLLALKNKNGGKMIINDIIFYTIMATIPILIHKTTTRYLPFDVIRSIILFPFWILLYLFIIKLYKKLSKGGIIYNLNKKWTISLGIIILATIAVILNKLTIDASSFLSDNGMIIDYNLYQHMFNAQFQVYSTRIFAIMAILGFFITPIIKNKKIRILSYSFIIGSFVFWVIAAKSIFFHIYYTQIIMITGAILISNLLIVFINKKKLIIIILLLLAITPSAIKKTEAMIYKAEDVNSYRVIEYLKNNTSQNDLYIDEAGLLSPTIELGLNRAETRQLSKLIDQKNSNYDIWEGLSKNNIKFIVTNRRIDYCLWKKIFTGESLSSIENQRSQLIKETISGNRNYLCPELIGTINVSEIEKKFQLKKVFGKYRIYTIN